MSEKAQMPATEDAHATALEKRSLPISDLKIPMPETKPPKQPTSAEQTGTTSQNQADG